MMFGRFQNAVMIFWIVRLLSSVRRVRDETEGRPLLVRFWLGVLCTCTSQLRSLDSPIALISDTKQEFLDSR
jgi:hypothetical protein